MKITKDFIVEVGDAKFYFDKPTLKELHDKESNIFTLEGIFKKLKRIEGVTDSDGVEVGTDRVMELPVDAVMSIRKAWETQIFSFMGIKQEAAEKKA